ncbi:FAD-binding domain protein [Ceratobasidium sp. AG-Ba]|nr:FAD-binding domain protein [Ceratobasidium sp. AG-Ba]
MPSISPTALATLRAALSPSAAVYLPEEDGYSTKRWAVNAEKPAALVACPVTSEDVVQILTFTQSKGPYAAQEKIGFAVKSGGYSPSGTSSSEGGIVIDLGAKMHDIRVDPTAKLVYAGGGCTWGQVDAAAIDFGLATVSGMLNNIGVGELTLDAGLGWLTGQHGMVIDNVVQMTVVTSWGDILIASQSENSDLFWALRGGGGNFGIVTQFAYRLYEQRPQVYSSALVFPPPMAGPVTAELNAWLSERTCSENALVIYTKGVTSQPVMVLHLVYNGDPEEGEKKFERFKKLCPVRDTSGSIPFTKLNTLQNAHTKPGKFGLIHASAIPAVSSGIPTEFITSTFSSWLKFMQQHPAIENLVTLIQFHHPDKRCSVASDATAYPNRQRVYDLKFMIQWTDPKFTWEAQDALERLSDVFNEAQEKHFTSEVINTHLCSHLDENLFTSAEIEARFGDNYQRLVEVKNKFDPSGLFGEWFVSR